MEEVQFTGSGAGTLNLDIDNSIMGKVYEIDDRVIFNKDYNNSIFESQKIKYIFNVSLF